jgi:hypothetical protein
VMPVPGSFEIMDLRAGELRLSCYPRPPLPQASLRHVVRGRKVDVLVGNAHAPTTEGDIGHGQSGCYVTGSGYS